MEEALYEDYRQRRDAEWKRQSGAANGRQSQLGTGTGGGGGEGAPPKPARSPSDYKLNTDNAYRQDGYVQNDSQLGEDPLTTVRTMRNNLRRQAIVERENGRTIKERVCNNAINELTTKENELVNLNKKKTDALLIGDLATADSTRKQMQDIKEDVIRNNYADLITDDSQIRAYGVDSKWTRDVRDDVKGRTPTPTPPVRAPSAEKPRQDSGRRRSSTRASSGRASSARAGSAQSNASRVSSGRKSSARAQSEQRHAGGRFVPNDMPYPEDRSRTVLETSNAPSRRQGSAQRTPSRTNSKLRRSAGSVRDDYEVKKNARLADVMPKRNKTGMDSNGEPIVPEDDPYRLPSYYGKCPYCNTVNENFAKQFVLDEHYTKDCKMLNNCPYCGKVVLVSELTTHLIERCDFLKKKKVHCKLCGLATEREDDAADVEHPLCRRKPPPSGAQWCPLCSVAVDDNKESWIKHLVDGGCYNNERASKTDPKAKSELVPDTLFLTQNPTKGKYNPYDPHGGAKSPIDDEGRGGRGGAGGRQPDPVFHGPTVDMRNKRLIDADQLVAALKVANEKKKAEKKKKKQQIEEKAKEAYPDNKSSEWESRYIHLPKMSASGTDGVDGTAPQFYSPPVDLGGVKLIDPNKLIATMEKIQKKKSKQRAKQMAAEAVEKQKKEKEEEEKKKAEAEAKEKEKEEKEKAKKK